jgi:hypothetical protein
MAGLTSLASKLVNNGPGEKSVNAMLSEIDDDGVIVSGTDDQLDDPVIGPLAFQYFPESLSDTKQVNYQRKDIPGGSLPIYQWISSGERLISFTAVFTSDTTLISNDLSLNTDLVERHKTVATRRRNVDIRAAIAWLRRHTLPAYLVNGSEVGVPISKAPRKLCLSLKNSGIGISGGQSFIDSEDSITCVMTQCDVTYEAFFPTGIPRIASVSLAFAQIPQIGDVVYFPERGGDAFDAVVEPDIPTSGYFIGASQEGEGFGGF